MKILISIIFFLFAFTGIQAQVNSQNHYVSGYTKSNGTYVQGYYQTNANSTINDNYSTYPNVNPYNGKVGTVTPTYSYTNTSTYSYSSAYASTPKYSSSSTYSFPTTTYTNTGIYSPSKTNTTYTTWGK